MYFKDAIVDMLNQEKCYNSSSEISKSQYNSLLSKLTRECQNDSRFKNVIDIISEVMDNQCCITHGDIVLVLESILTDSVDGMQGFFFSDCNIEQDDEQVDDTTERKRALEFIADLSLFVHAIGHEEAEFCEEKVYTSWFKFMKAKYYDAWGKMGIENWVSPIWDIDLSPAEFFKYTETNTDGKYFNLLNLIESIKI